MEQEFYYFSSQNTSFVLEKNTLSINVLSQDLTGAVNDYLVANRIDAITPFNQRYVPEIQELLRELCGNTSEIQSCPDDREYIEINIMATNDCNLNCSYCFAREVFQKKFGGNMSFDVAKRAVDLFISSGKLTSIIFMGGEPTLVPKLVKQIVNYATEQSISLGYKVPFFPIVTNATLLDSDLIDFIKSKNMDLIISYDGTAESHDINRVFSDETASSETVLNSINAVKAAGIPLHIDATFTKRHMRMGLSVRDIYEKLVEKGAEDVYVMPVVAKDKDIGFSDEDSEHLFGLFSETADMAVKFAPDTTIPFSYPRSVLSVLRDKLLRKRVCDAGINSFTIMPNGDIFPCYFLSQENHHLGNVADNSLNTTSIVAQGKALLGNNLKENFSRCQSCWAENICFGCYGPGIQEHDTVAVPPEYFCSILRGLTFGTIQGLIREWEHQSQNNQVSTAES